MVLIQFNNEEAKNNIDILISELKLIDFGQRPQTK